MCLVARGQMPARHHEVIARELQALATGQTRRLMLLLPPGSAKSTYASVLFPAWWLLRLPMSAVLAAAHTEQLALHFGRAVRATLCEQGGRLGQRLSAGSRAAACFALAEGGNYFATGVRGSITGRRADLAIIDDPIRGHSEAERLSHREALWDWYRSELLTRLKPDARVLIAMTRWHPDDLCGRLLASGEPWQVVRLPALAEIDDPMGREPGEALWSAWENKEAIAAKRDMLGEHVFSALFQQRPLRDEGRLFDPRTIHTVDACPAGRAIRAWDLAGTEGGDWTVGLKLVRAGDGAFCIDDVVRVRSSPAQAMEVIRSVAVADGTEVTIALPQDPGQAGKFQVQYMVRELAGFRVLVSPESGSKSARAMPVAAQAERGNVSMRRAPWNTHFLDEVGAFPDGDKDDQVDALSRAFHMLTRANTGPEFRQLPVFAR